MNHLERWKNTLERKSLDRLPRLYLGTAEFSQSPEAYLGLGLDEILHDRFEMGYRFQNDGCEGTSWEPTHVGPELSR